MSRKTYGNERSGRTKAASRRVPHIGKGRLTGLAPVVFAFLQDFAKHQEPVFPEQETILPVAARLGRPGPKHGKPDHPEVKAAGWIMPGLGVSPHRDFRDTFRADDPGRLGHREIPVLADHVSDRWTVSRFAYGFHPGTLPEFSGKITKKLSVLWRIVEVK
jgi:hypothetical protein